jgi:hypothetical protein
MSDDVKLSTLDELFGQVIKRRFKILDPLPVSGLQLRIRSLTEAELSDFNAEQLKKDGTGLSAAKMKDSNRKLIALCVVDSEGNRLIPDTQRGRIAEWDSADTQVVYNECANWVGLKSDFLETFAKNSGTTTDDD